MSLQLVWDNLVAYSMQIGLLVGLAAFVPAVLRLRLPAGRLAYWHILLAACLLLPAIRPWKQAVLTFTAYVPPAIAAPVPPQPPPAPTMPLAEIALILLGAGMLVRMAWLATGLWRLARLRRQSRVTDVMPVRARSARQTAAYLMWQGRSTTSMPSSFLPLPELS